MALTVTTDLTVITTAESLTGWTQIGGTDTADTDYFAQGTACISLAYNTGSERGSCFDIGSGATLNFSTTHAGKLIYIWLRCAVPALIGTRASGAMKIILGSGATAPAVAAGVWSAWYVDGSDTIVGTDGWKLYVIDPNMPASQTFGGGVDLTAVRWFGATMTTTASVKGNPFGIDQISYGHGELRCSGTVAVEGTGFAEMAATDFCTTSPGSRWGVMTEKEGVFYVTGRLVIGDNSGTAATTFSSQNETLVWNYPTYYDGTRERPCMNDRRADGTPYFGITLVGNGTGATNVTFGAKVGTGDTASGRSGPTLVGSRHPTGFDGDDGAVEDVLIYGTTFRRFRDGIDLSGNTTTDDFIGNTVIDSGSLQAGTVELRNNVFINGLGGAYKTLDDFINARATAAEALTTADPKYDWAARLNGSNLSIPSATAGYVELLDPGASDRREVVQINSDVVGNDDHYAEMIVRWPSGGANQGAMGPCIRMSATQEDYYYLKADLLNDQISLIRCDNGADTVIDGADAFAFDEDTDYLLHLIGNGTLIEGFVNGQKVLASAQSSYQTNRRVGIRGDAEADQTGDAPRMRRFGAGPESDKLGAVWYPAAASADVKNCKWINCARALSVSATGTYAFTGHTLSGNLVDVRNWSNTTATITVTLSDTPTRIEEVGSAATTISSSVDVTITVVDKDDAPIATAQTSVYVGATEVMNEDTNASGVATQAYTGSTPASALYRVRKCSGGATKYVTASGPGVIASGTGMTIKVVLRQDPINNS